MAALRIRLALGIAAAFSAPAHATHDTAPGMTVHSTTSEQGTMAYSVYAPLELSGKVPLFVHLHGGTNSAEDSAHRSRFNELALQKGFVVVYPQQEADQNNGIWDDQGAATRGREDRASTLIARLTREVIAAYPIDTTRVIVGGISAGASMAGVMAAQYPDLFTGIQLEAGAQYGKTTEPHQSGRDVFAVMGHRGHRMPLMLSYGTLDAFAATSDGEGILTSWLVAHDLMDDGAENGSVSLTPARTRTGTEGKSYSVDTYLDSNGCVLAERWLIDGLGHAYSGGDPTPIPADPQADPMAPAMRAHAYEFLMDQFDADGPPSCSKAAVPASSGSLMVGALDPQWLLGVFALAALGVRRRLS